jgi:PRTRC genetic system protein A
MTDLRNTRSAVPRYHLLTSRRLPPFDPGQLGDYVVAGDGVLMRVPYMGMLMDFPVVPCSIRGLVPWTTWGEGEAGEDEEPGQPQPFAPHYHVLTGDTVPPLDEARMFEYLIAGNGVFLRARRRGIEVLLPVSPPCELVGLQPVAPYVELPYPRVGPELVTHMFDRARAQTQDGVHFEERLFYLLWREGRWEVFEPEQEQRSGRVEPIDKTLAAQLDVFAEAHSHHTMSAFFSPTDDSDEKWFGVYAVLGRITTRPEVRTRVVVDGYRWECPAEVLYDLPPGVRDCSAAQARIAPRRRSLWPH